MSALRLLRGILLSTHLISIANAHSSARAEALAHQVPPDRLAPILDVDKLPERTADGRTISRKPSHHLQNVLRKRIARGEIPPPDTVGVSMAMLMRVAGALADLNEDDLGSWASLTYLAEMCDASPSQIRAVHGYLVQHGHSLRLRRLKADERRVGGAKRPLVTSRTTIRPVFSLTCDMIETLSEEQVLDLIALGERRPVATPPVELHVSKVESDDGVAAPRDVEQPDATAKFLDGLAPEHRCLIEPLAALSQLTGISLPTAAVEWLADEAERAGLIDIDNVDYSHTADAVNELVADLQQERRGAEAMGEPPPKVRGGRAGLRARITSYLKGKAIWLKKRGGVDEPRGAARSRELARAALLADEPRESEGQQSLPAVGGNLAAITGSFAPAESQAHAEAPNHAALPSPHEQAVNRLRNHIAFLGACIFAEGDSAKKTALEAERADAERRLTELRKQGPPE